MCNPLIHAAPHPRRRRPGGWVRGGIGLSLLLFAPLILAQHILRVGPQAPFQRIADAAAVAQDGDTVLIAAGTYPGDVTTWTQRKLTIVGEAGGVVVSGAGRHAEGKALWVIRDGDFVIDNVTFSGARVPDGNGAGIRFEGGSLHLRRCTFRDNQMGLLTGNRHDSRLIVEDSLFTDAPEQSTPLPHLLYVGRIASLAVRGSRFQRGHIGHLIKSRAAHNDLRYNLIDDGPGGRASYELDFPNGGEVRLIGNRIGQSASTENPVVIAYGAEGLVWPDNRLLLAHNTLSSARPGAWFLRLWHDGQPPPVLQAYRNLTAGFGVFEWGIGATGVGGESLSDIDGNVALPPGLLDAASPALPSLLADWLATPATPGTPPPPWQPDAQFQAPLGTHPLPHALPMWLPGAWQPVGADDRAARRDPG